MLKKFLSLALFSVVLGSAAAQTFEDPSVYSAVDANEELMTVYSTGESVNGGVCYGEATQKFVGERMTIVSERAFSDCVNKGCRNCTKGGLVF